MGDALLSRRVGMLVGEGIGMRLNLSKEWFERNIDMIEELKADNADELIEAMKARVEEALRALRLIRHFAIHDAMEPKSIVSLCEKVLRGDL